VSMAWKNSVIKSFGRGAAAYNKNTNVQKSVALTLAQDLKTDGVTDILELGCGSGHLTAALIDKFPRANIYATDASADMVGMAQKTTSCDNVAWGVMDAESPDTNKTYDLIVSNMAVQWFETPEPSIRGLLKLLNPNGALYFTLPSAESFPEWLSVLTELGLSSGVLEFPALSGIYKQEYVTEPYTNAYDFLASMKAIGAGRPRKGYQPMDFAQMRKACHLFDQRHNGFVTWHIQYGCLNV